MGDTDTGVFSPGEGKIALVTDTDLILHNNGDFNLAFGRNALFSISSGTQNVAVGQSALGSNDAGSYNTALGYVAMQFNTSGSQNTAVGNGTLFSNQTGADNSALGAAALSANTTGARNSAFGSFALFLGGTGDDNVAIGLSALSSNSAGDNNVAVGNQALLSNTTGNNNIALGHNAGQFSNNSSNSIYIGHIGTGIAETDTIRIGTAQTRTFFAGIRGATTANTGAIPVLINSAGQLGTVSSSRRYKFDINSMGDVNGMLAKLRPVTFRYNQAQDGGAHPLQYGLIAEEVAEVFPDLTVFNKDGAPETVSYHLLPSFLLAGYQAQQKTIDAQAARIETLEQRLAALEAKLGRMAGR